MCCIDYEGFTGLGNIHKESLENILKRNKTIITDLKETESCILTLVKNVWEQRQEMG